MYEPPLRQVSQQAPLAFASLGSGSKGNATLVQAYDSQQGCVYLLIDCGFSLKELERRLKAVKLTPEDITAVLVTHEHRDHIHGVGPLARKYGLPVYMTAGTFRKGKIGKLPALHLIHNYAPFWVKSLHITPVAVPHDACEPAQYIMETAGVRLGVLTDLGNITPYVTRAFNRCHGLILEANHDLAMLASSGYPISLKQRVQSPWGHLSNQQAVRFLQSIDHELLQHLVIAHISEQTNCLEKVQQALQQVPLAAEKIVYADQAFGFDWLNLEQADERLAVV